MVTMMMQFPAPIVRLFCGLLILATTCGTASAQTPPVAMRQPAKINLGGQTVTDDYWWLRNKDDPKVIDYLKAENTYTDAMLKPEGSLQDKLFKEMVSRIRETDEAVPYRIGDWWYSSRTEKGKQYPIYLRRKGSPTTQPMVVADVNAMA
jgi:oligopeptidase B